MRNLIANALLNLKEVPQSLYVHGSLMTYHENDKVEIIKAVPQGINPIILLLNVTVTEGSGPMKGTPKPFQYVESGNEVTRYKQVTINYEETSLTIDIQILG